MRRFLFSISITVAFALLTAPAIADELKADYLKSGREHFNKREYDAAIEAYAKAIEVDPRDSFAYAWRGNAYRSKGKFDLAIIDLNTSIELNPRDAVVYAWRGNAYVAKKQYDLAIADLTKSIELNPRDAVVYAWRGNAYRLKSQYDLAITDLTKSIELNPRDAVVYAWRGNAYVAKKQYDLAITDLTKSIELNPRDAVVYAWRGNAYRLKSQYDLAITDLTKSIELNPRDAVVYAWRGNAYAAKGQYDLAITDLAKSIELNPRDAVVYAWRGTAYLNKGQYDLALADGTDSIALNPMVEGGYVVRGTAYVFKGQFDLAIADLNRSIEINPRDAVAYDHRAFAHLIKSQYDLAAADYNTAIELNPKNADALYHLGFINGMKGSKEKARTTLLKALAIDPAIIDKRAEYLDRPTASTKFYAQELIAISEHVAVSPSVLAKAKGISVEIAPGNINEVPDFKAAARPNDLAVIIGIENYQTLPKSDYSKSDAESIRDYLKALGFVERNIQFLTDELAGLSGMIKSIEGWLPNRVRENSRVFIYYSGHGAPDPTTGDTYMVPYDGDPNYLSVTGYSLKRLYDDLGKLKVAEVAVVLDSCFSGAGGRSVLAKGSRPLVMLSDVKSIPSNMAVLSATQNSQISTSSPEKGHGIFTYYFLKALKDGKKTLAEIYDYMKPLVEDEAKTLNVQQSPNIIPDSKKLKGRFSLRK